jgi:hypothetical protein
VVATDRVRRTPGALVPGRLKPLVYPRFDCLPKVWIELAPRNADESPDPFPVVGLKVEIKAEDCP